MTMESWAQLEALCQKLYNSWDSTERAHAESTLNCFSVDSECTLQCQYILENALTPYALMLASSSLFKQCASSIDNLASFYFIHITMGEPPSSPAALNLAKHISDCPGLFPNILKTFLEVMLLEDSGCQWSLSRSLLSLILISEEMFKNIKAQILASQQMNRQQHLSSCFDKLITDVNRNLEPKNREKFRQNLTRLRSEFRAK